MTKGRKPKWNFERIADQYNLVYSSHWATVDASRVKEDIRRNGGLFARLVRRHDPEEAYFYLKLVFEGQMTEEEVQRSSYPSPADVPLLRTFELRKDYEPTLPEWFRGLVRAWLEMRERVKRQPPPPSAPAGPDFAESISLSFYLMAGCLTDEAFVWAMKRVRAIWRMEGRAPESWYRWLYDQQKRATSNLDPIGPQREVLRQYESFGQGHGLGWAKPRDDRNIEGDLAHDPYGLPVLDYKSHLRQLVRVAGGDPETEAWQDWVEQLLWELRPRRGAAGWGPGDTGWLRLEFRSPGWSVEGRYVPHAPPTSPSVIAERSPHGEVLLRIAIPSRWVSPAFFPAELRDELSEAVRRLWGVYHEPLTHQSRIQYLQRLIRSPQTALEELSPLYDAWESEIEEQLPIEQQTGPEARRVADRQHKVELRIRDKHRQRQQRARKRLQE